MTLIYLGPARRLDLGNGTVIERRGEIQQLDDATRRALEKAGHRFMEQETGQVSPARRPAADPDDTVARS